MAGRKGRSGRKPKTLEAHLRDGTFRPDRHGPRAEAEKKVARARAGRLPSPPAWLPAYGKTEWRRIVRILHTQGILEKTDRAALAAYCTAWADLRGAQKEIRKHGYLVEGSGGTLKANPAVRIANAAATQIRAYCIEFGMTPSSREKVNPIQVTPPAEADPDAEEKLALRLVGPA